MWSSGQMQVRLYLRFFMRLLKSIPSRVISLQFYDAEKCDYS